MQCDTVCVGSTQIRNKSVCVFSLVPHSRQSNLYCPYSACIDMYLLVAARYLYFGIKSDARIADTDFSFAFHFRSVFLLSLWSLCCYYFVAQEHFKLHRIMRRAHSQLPNFAANWNNSLRVCARIIQWNGFANATKIRVSFVLTTL